MLSLQHSIEEQQTIINNAAEETSRVERQFFPFGKREKLAELKKTSDKAERKIKSEQLKIEEARPLLENKTEGKSEEEILEWMRKTMLIIPDVRDEIRYYERCKNELPELRAQIGELEVEIVEQKNQYENVAETRYSEEVKKALNYLTVKATEYSEFETFTKVFEQAVSAFKEANKVKVNKSDVIPIPYLQVWQADLFFDRLPL